MKDKTELLKEAGKLTNNDLDGVKQAIKDLEHLTKHPEVDEDNMHRIFSIASSIRALEKLYMLRLVSLLKQNHMIT